MKYLSKRTKIAVLSGAVVLLVAVFVIVVLGTAPKNNIKNGVLILNTNKSFYLPNENVDLSMTFIKPDGTVSCNADLKITVKGPKKYKLELSTKDEKISGSTTCSEKGAPTNDPDYRTYFVPTQEGTYYIKLANTSTKSVVNTKVKVAQNSNFTVERTGAVRISAENTENFRYRMNIKVIAQKDFKGQVVEKLPLFVDVVWQGPSKVTMEKDYKNITWETEMKAGETKEFAYEYKASTIGVIPKLSQMGKALILENGNNLFEEGSFWQIAGTHESN